MSKSLIKLKINGQKPKAEKIYMPSSFKELYDKAKNFLEKDKGPIQVFQIIDWKLNKIIKDEIDYMTFITDHSSEKIITLLLNITDIKDIDKIPRYQVENSSICFQSIINPKKQEKLPIKEEKGKERELTEDEKMKESIRLLVQSKLKILESKLYNDIKNNDQPIHNGIKCNICGTNNIRGIRYKCSICDNYNLCEKCEENSNHDDDHILLKLRKPLSENELNVDYSKFLSNLVENIDREMLDKKYMLRIINEKYVEDKDKTFDHQKLKKEHYKINEDKIYLKDEDIYDTIFSIRR